MIRRLIILLLIVGCDMLDKTYKCEVDCETTLEDSFGELLGSCYLPLLQVDALDVDEAEEYCYDWYELDSLNNVHYTYSCNCEVFN